VQGSRRAWLVGLALLALLARPTTASPQPQALPELSVKAAFVAKFPSFISWPPHAARQSGRTLCLSPSQPFRDLVERLAADTRIEGHTLGVRRLKPGQSPDGCDAVFVAPVDHAVLQRVRGQPVVTIGDEPGFCERGGIINLRVIDDRVRFEINLARAQHVGLVIDAQLLALAARVHGGRR
jgi:hypothetical protein